MPGTLERRTGAAAISPREAAFVTGLSEKTINQAIDRDEVETVPPRREDDHDRMLAFSELVYLRLRETVGRLLSPEGKQMLREQLAEVRGEPTSAVSLGALELTVAPEMEAVKEGLASIEQARSFVTAGPRGSCRGARRARNPHPGVGARRSHPAGSVHRVERFTAALEAIRDQNSPLDMVNTVLEVDAGGTVIRYSLPDEQ